MKAELFFRYVISILGLLSFAALLALVAVTLEAGK
jgi:hypothetical protein